MSSVVMSEAAIRDFSYRHGYSKGEPKFIRQLQFLDLSDRQIAGVIKLVETFCMNCYDGPRSCKCDSGVNPNP